MALKWLKMAYSLARFMLVELGKSLLLEENCDWMADYTYALCYVCGFQSDSPFRLIVVIHFMRMMVGNNWWKEVYCQCTHGMA